MDKEKKSIFEWSYILTLLLLPLVYSGYNKYSISRGVYVLAPALYCNVNVIPAYVLSNGV